MVLVTVQATTAVLIKKNPRRLFLRGFFLDNLFSGFFEDNFGKVFADFAQMPGIARQKNQFAVMIFGNIHL